MLIDCPVRSGRSAPLVPLFTSVKLPRIRGVNGRPDAMVQSPLHCQSPNTARQADAVGEPFPVVAKRQFPEIVRGEAVRLVETG